MKRGMGRSAGRREAVSKLARFGVLAAGSVADVPLLAACGSADNSAPTPSAPGTLTRVYQPLTEDLRNPERGVVEWAGDLLDDDRPQWLDHLVANANMRFSLVRWPTDLGRHGYIDKDTIPDAALHRLSDNLIQVKRYGLKAAVRFMYSYPTGSQNYRNVPHPPLERMLGHIEQLGPVLHAHRELIAFADAGFVGPWGEWHSTDLFEAPGPRARVKDQLLASFPGTILFRYPRHVREWYGDSILSEDGGSPEGRRIGLHNDSILSLQLHNGNTWRTSDFLAASPLADRIDDRLYARRMSRYRPYGGEVAPEDPTPYLPRMSDPVDHATRDLRLHHFQCLNSNRGLDMVRATLEERDPAAFPAWLQQLGYRFVLIQASCDEVAKRGQPFRLSLTLRNDGASRIMHPRALQLRFVSVSEEGPVEGTAHDVILTEFRPWDWAPSHDGEPLIESGPIELALAPGMKAGHYDLGLRMPDPDSRLAGDGRYSVRPANADMGGDTKGEPALGWDEASGTFMLGLRVRVL